MVSATLFTNLILASAALAAPSLETSLQRTAVGLRSNQDLLPPAYTFNRAGALYEKPENTFLGISGTFTIPNITSGSVNISIGIDGHSCISGGVEIGLAIEAGGDVDAWFKWHPGTAYDFPHSNTLNFSVGHVVNLSFDLDSHHGGFALIENVGGGQSHFVPLHSLNNVDNLCGKDAMWVVSGDYSLGNFGTVVISDAVANTTAGPIGPEDAYILSISRTEILTTVAVDSSSVTIIHN